MMMMMMMIDTLDFIWYSCCSLLASYGNINNMYHVPNLCTQAHHGDNNNWGEFNTVEEVIATAQNRAKVASKTMPDCLGGGIGASSPVWMRDYSQPNDRYVFYVCDGFTYC